MEWTGFNLLTRASDADNHAFAPAFVAAFQRGAHHVDVTDTLEAEVDAAVGEFNNHILNRLIVIIRVDKVGGTHLSREGEFFRVGIHRQNAPGFRLYRPLDHRQADPAEAEDGDGIALFYFRRIVHRADAGRDAAAQQANFIQRRLRVHFRQRNFSHHGVFAEGAGAHIVINRFAVVGETRGAVRHQALTLGGADRLAEVGFA